jgi:hypothetical protein
MHPSVCFALPVFFLAAILPAARAQSAAAPRSGSLVIVFRDGHRQTLNLAEIQRLEFPGPVPTGLLSVPGPSRAHFFGKWEVGDGAGSDFTITLREDGTAQRTMHGIAHERGTWQYVNGEAQITWNDGWHDALRKDGPWYRKYAYSEGKTFRDEPDNVTNARNFTQNPGGVD